MVEKTRPQERAITSGMITGLSPPNPYAVGNKAAAVVKVVRIMGLNRRVAAPAICSSGCPPFAIAEFKNEIITNELLTTTPIKPIIPTTEGKLNGILCKVNANTTPAKL